MQLSTLEGILAMPKSAYPIACSVCMSDGSRFEAIYNDPEGPELLKNDLRATARSIHSITAVRWNDTTHRPIH